MRRDLNINMSSLSANLGHTIRICSKQLSTFPSTTSFCTHWWYSHDQILTHQTSVKKLWLELHRNFTYSLARTEPGSNREPIRIAQMVGLPVLATSLLTVSSFMLLMCWPYRRPHYGKATFQNPSTAEGAD